MSLPVDGVAASQDSAHTALGFDAVFHNGVRLFAQAQADWGQRDNVYAGFIGARINW